MAAATIMVVNKRVMAVMGINLRQAPSAAACSTNTARPASAQNNAAREAAFQKLLLVPSA